MNSQSNPQSLPEGLESYRRTDIFTEATIPTGLLKDHTTKAGTWGVIHVLAGRLGYRITDPRREPSETILSPETTHSLVEPTILHHVEPLSLVRFQIELHRVAEPVPLCRHEELARRENRLRAERG